MFHYKLIVAYDGTNYQGFQRQKNGIGVQQVIEKALTKLFKEPVELVAAGRTDAGVHARGQVVSFTTQKNIPAEKLPQALGHLLPKDVVILEGTSVDANFHARYGAVAKTYEYKIYLADQLDPCQRNYTWQLQEQLDVPAMEEATQYILGTHDFTTFRNAGSTKKTSVRTIESAIWQLQGNNLTFTITGNGFLYRMVRNLVGGLVKVGKGKITPVQFKELLEAKERKLLGMPAPASGLYLTYVKYAIKKDEV